MNLFKTLLILFFFPSYLLCQNSDLNEFMKEYLNEDIEYKKKKNKLEFALSKKQISSSVNLFDVFFDAQTNNKQIIREQYEYNPFNAAPTDTENSTIEEFDEEIEVGISRKFFKKDFVNDNISNRLDVFEAKYKFIIYKFQRFNEIFDNFINRKEAIWNLEILNELISINTQKNLVIQNLYEQKNGVLHTFHFIF